MEITLTIDPNGDGQIVYSTDLNQFVQLYLLPVANIQDQLTDAQQQLANAQALINSLTNVIALQQANPANKPQ
jgi:hypothetical protein